MPTELPGKDKLDLIADNLKPYIHRTPVMTSRLINEIAASEIFFKCENFQKTGSFKIRGAMNAVLALNAEKRAKGVVTHSSGNFAQALAYAANQLAFYVIMPMRIA